jgi:type IV secretion system protein VirB11
VSAAVQPIGGVYLRAYLAPFAPFLERDDVTDIFVNRPGEVWLETTSGGTERVDAPGIDDTMLWRLARQIASQSDQGVNREHPLLAATLPDGARVQICAPPATRGPMALAIRKHVVADLTLDDYAADGSFANVALGERGDPVDDELAELLARRETSAFLKLAVKSRKNIVIAGGTSTGKTTFLNALLKETGREERLLLIEDTPEIKLDNPNAVGLVAVRGELGEARVTAGDLLEAALRMRPDRIVMGELRGAEALSFLRAVNTGHPGSITTVHADSPKGAVDQLALMAMQAGTPLGRSEIADYVRGVIDVFVQLVRADGRRSVSAIAFERRG